MIVFGFAAESIFRYLTLIAEKLRARYEKKQKYTGYKRKRKLRR